MKKVMLINHGLASGGTDSFVCSVARGLPKDRYEISLVMALDKGEKQFREDEMLSYGVTIYRTNDLGSIKRMLGHAKRLYGIIREQKPDVVHGNMDLFNGINMFVAWLAGVPVRVCHSHNSASQYEQNTGKHGLVSIYRFVMRIMCKLFSNRYCGCSGVAMAYLFGARWADMDNAMVINNGVDTTRFTSAQQADKKEKRKIVTVARLAEQKNPFFAIEVIEQLSKIRQDFEYLWVGNGELMDAVRTKIEEKGLQEYVKLLGVRSDVDAVLADCDVFLLPSLFEGFGIVLVEAQAAGLPCLASDTVPQTTNCGGCLYESLNSPASRWAQLLSDLLDGKIAVSIEAEKLEKFDTGYMIRQLEEVYGG